MKTEIDLDNGKYKIIMDLESSPAIFKALRYGEEWQDLLGDNLVYFLVCRIIDQEEELKCLYEDIGESL